MASLSMLTKKRGWAKACISRTLQALEKVSESSSIEILENRLAKLEDTYNDFVGISQQMYTFEEDDNFEDPLVDAEEYENKYFEAHAILTKTLKEKRGASNTMEINEAPLTQLARQQALFFEKLNSKNHSSVHLANISLPKYSGNYQDWPSFRDLFLSAVDKKLGLSDTQKFQYLKLYLEGEALNLIKHISVTESNYKEAWERLSERYDRKPLIVRSLVNTFLCLARVSSSDVASLRKLSDGADEVLRGLKSLDATNRDPWLVQILLNKLDDDTKRSWAEASDTCEEKTIEEFLKFLSRRCDALESSQSTLTSTLRTPRARGSSAACVAAIAKRELSSNSFKCAQCKEPHALYKCSQFKALDVAARRALVTTKKLCFNCLRSSHTANNCKSQLRCRECNASHHTFLHINNFRNAMPTSNSDDYSSTVAVPETVNSVNSVNHAMTNQSINFSSAYSTTILPTVLVNVANSAGNTVSCRILLDTGSTATFVKESLVQALGISRKNARISVSGLSSSNVGVTRGCVYLNLSSRISDNSLEIEALVLAALTSSIPTQSIDLRCPSWTQILSLPLADPSFGKPGPIDIIIGSDQLWSIFTVRTFMELENVTTTKKIIDQADPCESHFAATHMRDADGSYIVEYPFKKDIPPIDNTLLQTTRRLLTMELKFQRNPELKQQYTSFLQEYLAMGHMELIPPNEHDIDKTKVFYLAHHAVFKPDSSTTKCRVVFDGSCKDSTGHSLNSRLHIGPPIQRDLFGVCLRFRQHRYVFSADIEKMFRGIKVKQPHTDFQRILWRDSPLSPIQHYRLLTVTYGLAPSPFIAVRVLKQLAEDYQDEFPDAARVLQKDVYVDDILTGCDNIDDLLKLQSNLVQLLQKANFNLRKWSSNCFSLLQRLPNEMKEYGAVELDSGVEAAIKILGLNWSPCSDELFLKIKPTECLKEPTKRIVLAETSKIFDPLGIVAPTVVLFKILFQESWVHGLDWDDPLPDHLSDRWHRYVEDLPQLAAIRVPRYIASPTEGIELHGFADASSAAYAAVVYSRVYSAGTYVIRLVVSKTRVAPLKPVSIPRLELNAAHLLTKLIVALQLSLSIKVSNIYCWSDSEIVLHWLSSPPRRWDTFVCNRTAEILNVCTRNHWRHVKSADNPADCASRGLLPTKLIQHTLWWTGPPWLCQPESEWPKSKQMQVESSDPALLAEERKKKHDVVLCSADNINSLEILINRSSSWTRLQRIVAQCLRFRQSCAHSRASSTHPTYLTSAELLVARERILQHEQFKAFQREITLLQQSKPLPAKSPLLRYTPFIDERGLLRVGGRIKHANINFNVKHPILLPKRAHIVSLIIRHIHETNLHTGVEATFVITRQQFWILGGRNLVRSVIFRCKKCFMQRRATSVQIMGDLPSTRVTPSRCFLHCGLDYAGPVSIRLTKGRTPRIGKAWFAIFVCLSTKALHIELVSDLTVEAFLAAFRRFIARRGKPSDIYSDNATTFHGSKRLLDELQKSAVSQQSLAEIAESLSNDGVRWHFIPPSSPHFGGLWESNVKSIKLHLRRVISSNALTFEEYCTILTQIEAILNSRPLCTMSDTDSDPLTPAHFLIGEPYTSVPEPTLLDVNINRLKQWRNLQARVHGFWKRWSSEYLTSLQQRSKWQQPQPNIQPGAVIVLKEPNLPPSKWLIGRIIRTIPGSDGAVRVVSIKTAKGEYLRPVTKIAVLPNC